jgi:RNA polymerase sigma-70 factor (ECF subfamily)
MVLLHVTVEAESGLHGRQVLPGGKEAGPAEEDVLLGAWLVGDDAAFDELVRRHQALVLAIVRRYAATPEDARDLVQRTFLRALESARKALARGDRTAIPFKRWLIRVAVNLAKNHRRDTIRWATTPYDLSSVATGGISAPDALARAEASARARHAALLLPRRQREVLMLRIDGELPFAEIAAALDITENAAKVSFHHAVKRLRAELTEEGA